MPKIPRSKKPPADFDKVEPTLLKLQAKLKEAQRQSLQSSTASKNSSLWPVLRLNHQISRYVYSMYYQRKAISKELYDFLIQQKYVNADLIAKWKKQGYENLCCVGCIIVSEKNHGTTCICRVPRDDVEDRNQEGCVTCGCRGCFSGD
ncbi:hypothetical protein OY671_006424 [Metschnikowia pulcherrima]|nr:hypothetical protein OY671_006424 [Metschnikowia pulcherrima]